VSTYAAKKFVDGSYFDMSAEPEVRHLPDWVTDLCGLLERAVERAPEFASLLDWLDTQSPFEDLEGFYLALQIRFDREASVARGVERVERWIAQHAVPSEVRIPLGKECIDAFLVTGADDCIPFLKYCAQAWKEAGDEQNVVWELLDHLGSEIARSNRIAADLDLLKVLVELHSDNSQSGGSRLVHALSSAFAGGAACSVGALEEWVQNYAAIDLGSNGAKLKVQLMERLWSEMDGLGWWGRRRILRMRVRLGRTIGKVDLVAALQVSESVSRRVFQMLPRARRPGLRDMLKIAVSHDIDERVQPDSVKRAIAVFGAELKRPSMLVGLRDEFSQDDQGAQLVYRALWQRLSRAGYCATGLELQYQLESRKQLKGIARMLRMEYPANWMARRIRRWWLFAPALALLVASYCWFFGEQVDLIASWIKSLWESLEAPGVPLIDEAPAVEPGERPSGG
jgi:hypothetical protein